MRITLARADKYTRAIRLGEYSSVVAGKKKGKKKSKLDKAKEIGWR